MTRIYLSAPDVGSLEEEYLVRALRSGWVAPLGPEVDALEREFAERIGVAHAVALSSGTAGLHLGLLALGVSPGDVVVTSTLTFAATANAIAYVGARPVFVDVQSDTGNLDPALLAVALDAAESRGDRVGAVMPVDLFGKVADYDAILAVTRPRGIPVLADAAESVGAQRGAPAGSFGDAAVFSFNGNKVMTTSGGGLLLTDDAALAGRVRHLATQARLPVPHYEHDEVGYNYRLSNLLAALGRAQLARLDGMIERRRHIREVYRGLFSGIRGVEVFGGDASGDNCWLTTILVDPQEAGWTAEGLRLSLAEREIESRPLWKPMHAQPAFAGSRSVLNGTADAIFATGLALPSGSGMGDEDLQRVTEHIRVFASGAAR